MKELFPVLRTSFQAFILLFSIYFVVCTVGIVLLLLFIFCFPITRSARLPLPQVALQEPFLNAQANKREMSAAMAGWQDNRPRGRKELHSRQPDQQGEVS